MNYKAFAYNGLREGGTFEVDATTVALIKADPKAHINKAVTFLANGTVGFGTNGDALAGIIEAIEPYNGRSDSWVMTVGWSKTYIEVPYNETTPPELNKGLAVDGTGKVTVATTGAVTAMPIIIDTATKTAVIRVM